MFFSHLNSPLTRSFLTEEIWQGIYVNKKTLDVHLHHLRKKIADHGYLIDCPQDGVWKMRKSI